MVGASASTHAWRALGQLRAIEAVEPLLAMQNRLDEERDDWYLGEFAEVFGQIGPPLFVRGAEPLDDLRMSLGEVSGLAWIGLDVVQLGAVEQPPSLGQHRTVSPFLGIRQFLVVNEQRALWPRRLWFRQQRPETCAVPTDRRGRRKPT